MSNRGIKLFVSSLMLVGILVLVLAATGIIGPGFPADPAETNGSAPTTVPATDPALTAEPSQPPSSTTISTTTGLIDLKPLTPDLEEPGFKGDIRQWPAVSSLPEIRRMDLSTFKGRSPDDRPLEGVTVILDPGHGGQDGGTVYPALPASPEIVEKAVVLAIAHKTRDRLTELGAEVVMTRDSDEWLSIYRRIAFAGKYTVQRFSDELPDYGYEPDAIKGLFPLLEDMIRINSDHATSGGRGFLQGYGARPEARLLFDIQAQYPDVVFISLHCNAYANDSSVRGLQVYYQTNDGNARAVTNGAVSAADTPPVYMLYDDTGRAALATNIRNSILSQLPEMKFTGHSDLLTADYAILRNTNLVSVLVEMGFVTSPDDRSILLSQDGQTKIARAVSDAVFN